MKIQMFLFAVVFASASYGEQTNDDSAEPAQSPEQSQQADPATPSLVVRRKSGITQVRERTADAELETHEDRESQLSVMTMDGSSEAAFEESLKKLHETAPANEYKSVKSAIQYLLVYDLNARGNKAKLYSKLDGKTPEEIIAMAKR